MGKSLTQQKRGKGSPTYRAHGFRYPGKAQNLRAERAEVIDIINSKGHTAPLLVMKYENNKRSLMPAPENIKVGESLEKGEFAELKFGNTLPLNKIPEGYPIFNIELVPGDGGKFVKSSGSNARIVTKSKSKVIISLPSSKEKELNPNCMATIGIIAGSGRVDKPFLKAGNKFKAMRAKGKYWPVVSGASMNAVDHPLGGARSSRKGRPTIAPRNAPPGRKVGMLSPRKTGRNK